MARCVRLWSVEFSRAMRSRKYFADPISCVSVAGCEMKHEASCLDARAKRGVTTMLVDLTSNDELIASPLYISTWVFGPTARMLVGWLD